MKSCKRPINLSRAAMALCLLAVSPAAFAYLDPSTGSMVVSAIVSLNVAAVATLLVPFVTLALFGCLWACF